MVEDLVYTDHESDLSRATKVALPLWDPWLPAWILGL